MKKAIVLLLTAVTVYSCSILGGGGKQTGSGAAAVNYDNVSGLWTEHWSAESDVTYVDTLSIEMSDTGLTIRCINDTNLTYKDVKLTPQGLTFTMENLSDPDEVFTVWYDMKIVSSDELSGRIINVMGTRADVKLLRETDEYW